MPSANPAITIADVDLTEGNAGQTALVFTVSLSKASSRQVSVNFATADGPPNLWRGAATAGSDYVSQQGILTFAPGERTKTITVLVNGDDVVEGHERFSVNLSQARNASISDAQGIGTILNDDLYPGTYIDSSSGWPMVPQEPPPPDDSGCDPNGPYFCP
jgi:serralysin